MTFLEWLQRLAEHRARRDFSPACRVLVDFQRAVDTGLGPFEHTLWDNVPYLGVIG